MADTQYSKAMKVMAEYKGERLHINALKLIISTRLASKQVKQYMELMVSTGLIKEIEPMIYHVLDTKVISST